MEKFLFPLFVLVIAVTINFGELLSRYEYLVIKDILNRYLFLYLLVNGIFAILTYLFLPDIASQVGIDQKYLAGIMGHSWSRVGISAFGYLVIVRSKFFTIKDTPIGADILYNTFANYCLRHTRRIIQNNQDTILDEAYKKFPNLETYKTALQSQIQNAPDAEKQTAAAELERVNSLTTTKDSIKCKLLGTQILRIVATKEDLMRCLQNAQI